MKARIVRYSFIGVVAVLIILCGMKFSNMYKDYQKLQFNQEQIDTQVSVLMSICALLLSTSKMKTVMEVIPMQIISLKTN